MPKSIYRYTFADRLLHKSSPFFFCLQFQVYLLSISSREDIWSEGAQVIISRLMRKKKKCQKESLTQLLPSSLSLSFWFRAIKTIILDDYRWDRSEVSVCVSCIVMKWSDHCSCYAAFGYSKRQELHCGWRFPETLWQISSQSISIRHVQVQRSNREWRRQERQRGGIGRR